MLFRSTYLLLLSPGRGGSGGKLATKALWGKPLPAWRAAAQAQALRASRARGAAWCSHSSSLSSAWQQGSALQRGQGAQPSCHLGAHEVLEAGARRASRQGPAPRAAPRGSQAAGQSCAASRLELFCLQAALALRWLLPQQEVAREQGQWPGSALQGSLGWQARLKH